jgi:hypothetical protein
MTFLPTFSLGNYLEESVSLPDDPAEFKRILKTALEDILKQVNRKDTGAYEEVEILNNQQFFGATAQVKRNVYRRVYDFGAIATGATLNIAHGLIGVTEFTRIYGTAVTGVPDFRPIPRTSTVNINQQISLDIVGVNIVIINGAGGPNITGGIIVLEYVKN